MEIKKLGELCDVVSGGTPSRSKSEYWDNGDIPWIKIGNIKDKYVSEVDEYITKEGLNGSSAKMLSKGTILYTIFATLGEVGILDIDACTNQAIAGISIKDSNYLSTDYLYYYLKSKKAYVTNIGRGVAQNNINMGILRDFEVPVPEMAIQKAKVDILDRVSSLIKQREAEIELLDELIKARFVEMFGDYHTNSKGFESHSGTELFKFSSGKFLPEEKRLEEGIPVYGGNGIAWYTDESLIDYPTIIIGRVGAWCGNIHTVTEPVWITDNAIFIKEQKTDKFALEFLSELMKVMDFHQYADFSGQPKITQKPLESLSYITPPVSMQNEFTDFVKQVDKSKVVVQRSLEESQKLFDSLMQEYFG